VHEQTPSSPDGINPSLVGVATMRGMRPYMEDTFDVLSFDCSNINTTYTLAGVFDGHAGGETSEVLSKKLLPLVAIALRENKDVFCASPADLSA
jgi:serine/threonine protein phosphatase PrpC